MWTLDDLCRKLHCTRETVYTWRKHGIAPRAYKVGKHLLFEESDVREWLEAHASDRERTDAAGGSDTSLWGW
jgi:excisionase family DNA binding protein